MSRWWVVAVLVACGCGGGGGSSGGDDGGGGGDGGGSQAALRWDVDGTHYTGGPQTGATAQSGVLVVTGFTADDAHELSFSVMATAAGTYDLTDYPGTSFDYADHAQSWTVSTSGGGTGTVVITSFTATEVTGTFTANPVPGNANTTGDPAITNGAFDLSP